jgi:hypothetical protein
MSDLFDPENTTNLAWKDLFRPEMSPEKRRQRWDRWRAEATKRGDANIVERWETAEACDGCKHLDGCWCDLQGLPCTVNPILTFRHGMIGMACMGAGYESNETALPLGGEPPV